MVRIDNASSVHLNPCLKVRNSHSIIPVAGCSFMIAKLEVIFDRISSTWTYYTEVHQPHIQLIWKWCVFLVKGRFEQLVPFRPFGKIIYLFLFERFLHEFWACKFFANCCHRKLLSSLFWFMVVGWENKFHCYLMFKHNFRKIICVFFFFFLSGLGYSKFCIARAIFCTRI